METLPVIDGTTEYVFDPRTGFFRNPESGEFLIVLGDPSDMLEHECCP